MPFLQITYLFLQKTMLSNKNLERLLKLIPHNQTYRSPIDGLIIHHSDRPFAYENVIQEPSICIVVRGEREIRLGAQHLLFDNRHFMFCPVDVPMCGKIARATPAEPFVVLSMKIDLQAVGRILLEQAVSVRDGETDATAFAQWHLSVHLADAFESLLLLNPIIWRKNVIHRNLLRPPTFRDGLKVFLQRFRPVRPSA